MFAVDLEPILPAVVLRHVERRRSVVAVAAAERLTVHFRGYLPIDFVDGQAIWRWVDHSWIDAS